MTGDKNPGVEYVEVTASGIPFIEIQAGKWQPHFKFWRNLIRIPVGFSQSLFWLIKIRPKLIVSFGGFLAVPVAFCGWFLGITVVTHEQTVYCGIANKIISLFAKRIFVSFESSLKQFPARKVIFTGLPIRPLISDKNKKLFDNTKKTIYITGGKQGAHVINTEIFEILPKLTEKFNVIHQCGSTSIYNDIEKAEQIKSSLGKREGSYKTGEYFYDSEIGDIYYSADFVICRAGAHTIYELLMLNKPAILIPIPWSNNDEQKNNAEMIKSLGLVKIFPQEDLGKNKFLTAIFEFAQNLNKYRLNSPNSVKTDATFTIVKEIERLFMD